jgi:hypothetical protein
MIGSSQLTTCNCGDIVAPHANFGTCELKWKLTKTFDSGDLIVYLPGNSGIVCIADCAFSDPGSIGTRWPGEYAPGGGLMKRVVVDQLDEGEATWTTFTQVAVQTVSGSSGGKYYRPGTATTSGGVVIAQNLTCKFRIYEANPNTASTILSSHGEVSRVTDCTLCGTYTNFDCSTTTYGPGSIVAPEVVTTGRTGSSTFSYPSPFASPPKIRVRWLAATQRVVGLKLTLTAAGSALGEWFVEKGPSGLTLSCATVTLVYPPTGKITPASTGVRAQIQATGYFTAVADSTVTTNAEVGDLQEMSKYLNGNGDCVELVLVPLNSIAAPSSIRFIKPTPAPAEIKYLGFDAGFDRDDDPVGSCSPTGSCTKGWVFQLNSEWTDDEAGFKQFISAARGLRIDVTNQNLTVIDPYPTGTYLQDPTASAAIPFYRFDIRYKAPTSSGLFGKTGWDYVSGPTSATRVSFSDPGGPGVPSKIYSRVDSGCLARTCDEISPCYSVAGNCPGVSVPSLSCINCPPQTLYCDGIEYHVCQCSCCQNYETEVPYTFPPISAPVTVVLDGNFKLVAT